MGLTRVSPNGRYFVDEAGRPFFWLGDTQWELCRLLTPQDADAVLAARTRQGFSVVQVMITGVGDGRGAALDGQTPWLDNDSRRPNERYFARLDAVVERSAAHGMVLALGVFHQLQVDAIPPATARGYARWIARRYRDADHVIWSSYPKAEEAYRPVLRELAAGLAEGDGGRHLVTAHPDPSPASSSFFHEEPWLSFNCLQTYNPYERVHPMVTTDYLRQPPKPVVMAEGGYDTAPAPDLDKPVATRRQAWWSFLAGGSYSYGHDGNWRAPGTWGDWIDAPAAAHLTVFRQVVTACPQWWLAVPDQGMLAGGSGSGTTLCAAARAADGTWALVYAAAAQPVTVRLERMAGGPVKAAWIDPRTGARTRLEASSQRGEHVFTPPAGWEDAVLWLSAGA